jgi:pyruvate kinase
LISSANDGGDVPILAKLERSQALANLEEIVDVSDGVMVARGDLGLEMPLERVPRAQKEITRSARQHAKPVVVATQVLESMTVEARPTRAEVSDAANAVEDGVDAIMLAGETAVGAFPARAVQTLDAIIRDAESNPASSPVVTRATGAGGAHAWALCEAAVTLAERAEARAIIAVTRGGRTARRLSALRPSVPVLAVTNRHQTARQLALYWGVTALCLDLGEDVESAGYSVGPQLVSRGLVSPGAAAVFVRINPDLNRMDANYLKVVRL